MFVHQSKRLFTKVNDAHNPKQPATKQRVGKCSCSQYLSDGAEQGSLAYLQICGEKIGGGLPSELAYDAGKGAGNLPDVQPTRLATVSCTLPHTADGWGSL